MKRGAVAAVVFGVTGVAVLIGLGVWQVKRLAWKETLVASLEQRLAATPVALPVQPDPERDQYLRVSVSGETDGRELHMLTSLQPYGPGFRVIAPLTVAGGRVVLVDLGYVPQAAKDAAARPGGPVEVVGALYWPDETDGFTPEPDRAANIWFARDLALMVDALEAGALGAGALGSEPVMVIAEAHNGGDWPKPRRLGVNLPNNHLQYAITWFSLALVWAVMSAMLVRRERERSGAG